MANNLLYNDSKEEDSYFYCENCGHKFADDDIDEHLKKCPECNLQLNNNR